MNKAQHTAPKSAPNLADAAELRPFFRVENHPSGTSIYRQGDAADRVYLLRSGRVRLLRAGGIGPDGLRMDDCLHAVLRPGDLFGEALRPADGQLEETAVAQGEVEAWCIESRDLRALVEARPVLALELLRALSDRTRTLRRRVNALTFKEVPARLAETILSLSETHGERCNHGGDVDLRGITQQDLADLVGASRSFVSTLVNEMKRDGLLGSVGRTICIRRPAGLRQLADRDRA